MLHKFRWASRTACLAVGAAAIVVPTTTAYAAQATATATPSSHLHGGDTVVLTGTGYAANSAAIIVECSTVSQAGCDSKHVVQAPTDGSGNFSATNFVVSSGTVGSGSCPSAASNTCYLVVTSSPGDATQTSVIPITFDPVITLTPATNVPAPKATIAVSGIAFLPNKPVYMVECSNTAMACDNNTLAVGQTDANGAFSASINVHYGDVGGNACTTGVTCYVGATTDITQNDPHQNLFTPFSFGTPTVTNASTKETLTAKKSGSKVTLSGSVKVGGSAPADRLKVTVYQRAKGTKVWKSLKTLTTDAKGTFKVSTKHQSHPEEYLVKHAKETINFTAYSASQSKISKVA